MSVWTKVVRPTDLALYKAATISKTDLMCEYQKNNHAGKEMLTCGEFQKQYPAWPVRESHTH